MNEAIEMLADQRLKTMDQILAVLNRNIVDFGSKFPTVVSDHNVYGTRINEDGWTQSFYTGMLWLAYETTKDERYLKKAKEHTESFRNRLLDNKGLETHDIGFLYTLSCVADYRLTGSQVAKETGILAADKLLERYKEVGEFIQAWGANGDPNGYRLIIDCYMNLPLLYWASQVTSDNKYAEAATKHAHTARKVVIRPDNSTYHTYYFDYETGVPTKGVTAQGYSDDSCWSRGQAWGIYGMALCYRYTKDPVFIEEFHRLADYFVNHLPEDSVAYWDLIFQEGDEERDSSAAAIAICGIEEMLPYLSDDQAGKYKDYADKMLMSLMKSYTAFDTQGANGLLLHGVYSKPGNEKSGYGVDEMNLWGDYYFMEAIVRQNKTWNPYW